MEKRRCILCDAEISADNDTAEHIIPQAIGGRRTISGFICAACNNSTGSTWEKKLAEQLGDLSLILSIKRQRGEVPGRVVETESGRKLFYNSDGSMTLDKNKVEFKTDGNQEHIHIKAKNMQDAEVLFANVRKKYPEGKFKCCPPQIATVEEFCPEMMCFQANIGGAESGRSIVKTALALASYAGADPFSCKQALGYLRSDSAACFGYYYKSDLVSDRIEGTPYHIVSVKGNPDSRLLLGYVEYFGCFRMVVCLSMNYAQGAFQETYALNPVDGKIVEVDVNLDFNLDDIPRIYNYEMMDDDAYKGAFEKVIGKAQRENLDREISRRVRDATEQAFAESGLTEGARISPEIWNRILKRASEILAPFVDHHTPQ